MTNIDILKAKEICRKYARKALYITIEFDRFGMVLRGAWDFTLNHYDISHFNREYSYEFLENLSEDITLEYLINEFEKEFETKLKEAQE